MTKINLTEADFLQLASDFGITVQPIEMDNKITEVNESGEPVQVPRADFFSQWTPAE
jgi:hypothetical protein